MLGKYQQIVYILIIFLNSSSSQTTLIFKNVQCTAADKNFARFDDCGYRTSPDGDVTFNIIIRLLKLPVTNCEMRLEVKMLALNLPVAFNATYDACKFMETRKKYRIIMELFKTLGPYMNINHSCPYNHDLLIKGPKVLQFYIPLSWPAGEYEFKTIWIIDKKVRVIIGGISVFEKTGNNKNKPKKN